MEEKNSKVLFKLDHARQHEGFSKIKLIDIFKEISD
jgi:hypothetical protein